MRLVFALAAVLSVLAVIFICIFLFAGGAPAFRQIGVLPFLTGQNWRPLQNEFGIFPMIIGSIYVTAGAIVVGVPLGIGTAVFLARFCPAPLYRVLKPAVNLLAGIPSIVYGFFGLTVLVPAVQALFGTSGKGVLTASLVLGIMILPTIINVSESALRAVPNSYYEGALALGATKERAVLGTLLRRSIKKGKPDLNILFQYNMPLRALAKMTNGAISMGMVDGIVMELRGFWIIGLVRVIFEAVKNLVLNSRMEERLKNS